MEFAWPISSVLVAVQNYSEKKIKQKRKIQTKNLGWINTTNSQNKKKTISQRPTNEQTAQNKALPTVTIKRVLKDLDPYPGNHGDPVYSPGGIKAVFFPGIEPGSPPLWNC